MLKFRDIVFHHLAATTIVATAGGVGVNANVAASSSSEARREWWIPTSLQNNDEENKAVPPQQQNRLLRNGDVGDAVPSYRNNNIIGSSKSSSSSKRVLHNNNNNNKEEELSALDATDDNADTGLLIFDRSLGRIDPDDRRGDTTIILAGNNNNNSNNNCVNDTEFKMNGVKNCKQLLKNASKKNKKERCGTELYRMDTTGLLKISQGYVKDKCPSYCDPSCSSAAPTSPPSMSPTKKNKNDKNDKSKKCKNKKGYKVRTTKGKMSCNWVDNKNPRIRKKRCNMKDLDRDGKPVSKFCPSSCEEECRGGDQQTPPTSAPSKCKDTVRGKFKVKGVKSKKKCKDYAKKGKCENKLVNDKKKRKVKDVCEKSCNACDDDGDDDRVDFPTMPPTVQQTVDPNLGKCHVSSSGNDATSFQLATDFFDSDIGKNNYDANLVNKSSNSNSNEQKKIRCVDCKGLTFRDCSVDCIDILSCQSSKFLSTGFAKRHYHNEGDDESESESSSSLKVNCKGRGSCNLATFQGGIYNDDTSSSFVGAFRTRSQFMLFGVDGTTHHDMIVDCVSGESCRRANIDRVKSVSCGGVNDFNRCGIETLIACKDANITNVSGDVDCNGCSSCVSAYVNNVGGTVECDGYQSCEYATLKNIGKNVICDYLGACSSTKIDGVGNDVICEPWSKFSIPFGSCYSIDASNVQNDVYCGKFEAYENPVVVGTCTGWFGRNGPIKNELKCSGIASCVNSFTYDVGRVDCDGHYSCYSAYLVGVRESVDCTGRKACSNLQYSDGTFGGYTYGTYQDNYLDFASVASASTVTSYGGYTTTNMVISSHNSTTTDGITVTCNKNHGGDISVCGYLYEPAYDPYEGPFTLFDVGPAGKLQCLTTAGDFACEHIGITPNCNSVSRKDVGRDSKFSARRIMLNNETEIPKNPNEGICVGPRWYSTTDY